MRWQILLLLLVVVAAGCTPQVIEFDVDVGKRLDSATGYYAYYSGLSPTGPRDVILCVADRATISGVQQVSHEDIQEAFPVVAYDPDRTYVHPAQLREYLGVGEGVETGLGQLEIGYFMKRLSIGSGDFAGAVAFLIKPSESKAGGLRWAEPTIELLEALDSLLPEMRAVAASQGADTIDGLSVFYISGANAWGESGVYVSARVFAAGLKTEEAKRQELSIQK